MIFVKETNKINCHTNLFHMFKLFHVVLIIDEQINLSFIIKYEH